MNVLLVDDEATLRKMVSASLKRRGLQVIEAGSAADALDLFGQHDIDVLVTDIAMDGMDGRALAKCLHERNPDLPVVYISGCAANPWTETLPSRRSAFLPKPFDPRELASTITELADVAA